MRYIYQFIIPLVIIAVFYKWLSYRYMRMGKLRAQLEELYREIEKVLVVRAKIVPEFIKYISMNDYLNVSIQQSIKSIEYVQNESSFDYQSQQQTISFQLNNIFTEINKFHANKDARLLILKKQLLNLDEDIQYASNNFNQAAKAYNHYINSSPVRFYAEQLGFFEAELFELDRLNG